MWIDASEFIDPKNVQNTKVITGYFVKDSYNDYRFSGFSLHDRKNPVLVEVCNEKSKRHIVHTKKIRRLHAAEGEMAAASEGMKAIVAYCQRQCKDPLNASVEVKTDYNEVRYIGNIAPWKAWHCKRKNFELLRNDIFLQKSKLGDVVFHEIWPEYNLAHNVCINARAGYEEDVRGSFYAKPIINKLMSKAIPKEEFQVTCDYPMRGVKRGRDIHVTYANKVL